jgi:hypothetical protein
LYLYPLSPKTYEIEVIRFKKTVFCTNEANFQGNQNHKLFISKHLQINDFAYPGETNPIQTQKQTHYCAKNAPHPQTNPILTRSFTHEYRLPTVKTPVWSHRVLHRFSKFALRFCRRFC